MLIVFLSYLSEKTLICSFDFPEESNSVNSLANSSAYVEVNETWLCKGFSITPSGIIYPCSRFYSADKYKLYDSNADIYFEDNINFIKVNNVTENEKCINCKINKFCNQGCYYSQLENESIIGGYCSVLKLIFKFTAGLYKEMKNECDVYITERKGVKF